MLLENAACNNKWNRTGTFNILQRFYRTNSVLFESIMDSVFADSVSSQYHTILLNREELLVKINEYDKKLIETKKEIETKQKTAANKILNGSRSYNCIEAFDADKLSKNTTTERKEFCKKYIKLMKLLYKDKNQKIKDLRMTKKKDNNNINNNLNQLMN
eukprot:6645_1